MASRRESFARSWALLEAREQARPLALAGLIFGAATIGLAPILFRLADAGPAAAGFWRVLFAMPLLLVLTMRTGGTGRPSRLSLLAGVFFTLDLAFWHYGLSYTSVANATVLTNLTPVVVTLLAWVFLRQRPKSLFLVALALAVAGAWTMAAAKGGAAGPNPLLGDLLSVGTALWYSLYFLTVGEARRVEGATRVMFWSTLVCVPLLLVIALAMGENLLPRSTGGWAACVGLGVMHVVGQGAIAWALGRLPASLTSVVVLIQPVVAAVLGWWLFAEALGPWQAAGAAVALSGVVLAQWASRPKPA